MLATVGMVIMADAKQKMAPTKASRQDMVDIGSVRVQCHDSNKVEPNRKFYEHERSLY